jgi:hypothetical protein
MPLINFFQIFKKNVLARGIWRGDDAGDLNPPTPAYHCLATEDNKGIQTEDGKVIILEGDYPKPPYDLDINSILGEDDSKVLTTENGKVLSFEV